MNSLSVQVGRHGVGPFRCGRQRSRQRCGGGGRGRGGVFGRGWGSRGWRARRCDILISQNVFIDYFSKIKSVDFMFTLVTVNNKLMICGEVDFLKPIHYVRQTRRTCFTLGSRFSAKGIHFSFVAERKLRVAGCCGVRWKCLRDD